MLDIETLGNKNNSVITSIAAVPFNPALTQPISGDTFHWHVDIQSCLDLGMEVSKDTLLWWLKQSDDARKTLWKGQQPLNSRKIENVLKDLTSFVEKHPSYVKVWGNSPRFDCGILQNAYNLINKDVPWNFRNERDVRTIVGLVPDLKDRVPFIGVPHNALDDCRYQIKCLLRAKHELNLKRL